MSKVPYEEAIGQLSEENLAIVKTLHERVAALGYEPTSTLNGKKVNCYNIEYKKPKSVGALYIVRIDSNDLLLRCKLFHLAEYLGVINELPDSIKHALLTSRGCGRHGSCKGPVSFELAGEAFTFCRHAIEFKPVSSDDVDGIWKLLSAEDASR
ncbi:hypothetical protein AGMMS49992_27220 [Clostridia bacterium]|nr:hypothetical protein AGMMS49992_27220 [Clostridia bacterium]